MKIDTVKAAFYLEVLIFVTLMFHIYYLIWLKFGARDLKIMLLSIYEFHENMHREGHTFLCVCKWNYIYMCTNIVFSVSPSAPLLHTMWSLAKTCHHFAINVTAYERYFMVSKHDVVQYFSQKQSFQECCGSGPRIPDDWWGKMTLWGMIHLI
jgi:hypothetical protein